MKYFKVHGRYYRIQSDLGDKWECYPAGGGFGYKIPKTEGEVVDSLPNQDVECFAVIPDCEMGPYKCVTNPYHRWNGWARPRFTLEVLNHILEEQAESIKVLKRYDSEIIVQTGDDEWPILQGKDGLWEIDGWCWDIQDDKGCYIYSDGTVQEVDQEDED